MKAAVRWFGAWIGALLFKVINWTCRLHKHNDPRPSLKASGQPYIYAILHAHQLAAVLNHEEPICGAMVSRSADGDLLIPSCKVNRVVPFRGSTRSGSREKGGREALEQLIEWVGSTGNPCTMAVDGPRGPRGHVHAGVARIAAETGARILVTLVIPSRRWITGTWDRLQTPKPFSRIDVHFAQTLDPADHDDVEGLRAAVERSLNELEREHDPLEVEACIAHAARRARREREKGAATSGSGSR